jgi:hypothetical protein
MILGVRADIHYPASVTNQTNSQNAGALRAGDSPLMGQATVATIEKILHPFAKDIRSNDVEVQGFDFTSRLWQEALGPDQDLEAALDRFGSRVTRGDLFELARECAKRPDNLPLHRQAFFGVMLWGYGRATRWGPGRVARHLQEVHRMPVTGFLAALAANQLASRILPDDVLGRPSHQFTPLS